MLRLVIALAVWVLSAAAAWAEAPSEAVPIEVQWLKVGAQVISTVGMPGVIAALVYLLKMQKDDREKEVAELKGALREEQAFNRKVQEDRLLSAAASADRLATVAVSSSNAITTAAEKNAGVLALCQEIKDAVAPVDGELTRILTNQDGLIKGVGDLAVRLGSGCRAP